MNGIKMPETITAGKMRARRVAMDRTIMIWHGNRLIYTLYAFLECCSGERKNIGYAVGVKGLGDTFIAYVGKDMSIAEKIFSDVSEGRVTACTLPDVVDDLRFKYEHNNAV